MIDSHPDRERERRGTLRTLAPRVKRNIPPIGWRRDHSQGAGPRLGTEP